MIDMAMAWATRPSCAGWWKGWKLTRQAICWRARRRRIYRGNCPKAPGGGESVTERIRQRIAQLLAAGDFNVTLSPAQELAHRGTAGRLMVGADQALYRSKAAGKGYRVGITPEGNELAARC